MTGFPIEQPIEVVPRQPIEFSGGVEAEAFPVVHSLRAPAVGYRVSAGRNVIFYVPDVIDIEGRAAALEGVRVFIGDGASLTRPLVRRDGDRLFGHTTVRAQIGWCRDAGIARALFTHCGSEIVRGDERSLGASVRAMGRERGVDARIAYDGLSLTLR
jgi:hypothetical protein